MQHEVHESASPEKNNFPVHMKLFYRNTGGSIESNTNNTIHVNINFQNPQILIDVNIIKIQRREALVTESNGRMRKRETRGVAHKHLIAA
jgi:hypothetical protein